MERIGELAALATALCFAVSSVSFGIASRAAGGLAVNRFRVLAALLLMLVLHVALRGEVWPRDLGGVRLVYILLSGVVGLAIGDVALFYAFGIIGPRLCSVLMAVWPALALLLDWMISNGQVKPRELVGVGLTTLGVGMVVLRGGGRPWNVHATACQRGWATAAALLGALGQAGGYLLARAAMTPDQDLPQGVPEVSTALVRMAAGAAVIVGFGVVAGGRDSMRRVVEHRVVQHTLFGTVMGPVAGIWLSLVAARHAEVSASALIVTTPLMLLPISYVVHRERVGAAGLFGTVLTVAGAFVLLV
jgi:drug/metabolite transporter (DMT)-like permease